MISYKKRLENLEQSIILKDAKSPVLYVEQRDGESLHEALERMEKESPNIFSGIKFIIYAPSEESSIARWGVISDEEESD